MYLSQDRHSRSVLIGNLGQKAQELRLSHLEYDGSNKYLSYLHSHVTYLYCIRYYRRS